MSSPIVHVLDYGAGNVRSITNAIERVGFKVAFVNSPADLLAASIVVFPGVGCVSAAIDFLDARGFREPLLVYLRSGRPFLGICLGMQTLFERSEEAPGARGLGLIAGCVARLAPKDGSSVPHIGWNGVARAREATGSGAVKVIPALAGLDDTSRVYFVHSFAARVEPANAAWVATVTDYGGERFISSVARGAIVATQFHPEKSGGVGLRVFENFLRSAAASVTSGSPLQPLAQYVPNEEGGDNAAEAAAAAAATVTCMQLLDATVTTPHTHVARRIIACLDVRSNDAGDLVVTKGDQYDVREKVDEGGGVRNLGKPVELCARYYDEGADEVCFLNITAFRAEPLGDEPMLKVLELSSSRVFVPLTVSLNLSKFFYYYSSLR
jgi:glutamine amidotransferase/cyclase